VTAPEPSAAPDKPPRPRTRVFLVGYYGFDNLGDEAIRAAIERGAARHGVEIVRYATRGRPAEERAVPVRGPGVWRYVWAIGQANRVVLGGGGILKDEGLWLPVELFLTALAARILGRPVALLAVGVGPFYRGIGRALVAATARLATVRTVRDADSAAALGRLGVRGAEVGADPVFTLAPPSSRPPRSAARRAVVSVRPWFLGDSPDREETRAALRRAVGQGIETLLAAGWQVDLVPLYWPRDRDESAALVEESGLAGRVGIVDRVPDWDALLEIVGRADLVVAMRYHAVAAAALAGCPTIALAYEPKVASLAADLGLVTFDVSDPELGTRLREAVEATLAGGTGAARPAAPERLASLHALAERSLALALTGQPAGRD
jgi:polysaccharide pyruvyl transferase CsaB